MKRFKHGLKRILPMLLAVFLTCSLTSGSVSYALENIEETDSIEQTVPEKQEVENDLQTQDQPTQEDVPVVDEPSPPQEEEQPVPEEVVDDVKPADPLPFYLPMADQSFIPAHSKKIESNKDGTYKISLDITGKYDETYSKPGANIVLVVDRSGSMNYSINGDYTAVISKSRMEILKEVLLDSNGLVDTLFSVDANNELKIDTQMAIVTYSGSQHDGQFNDAWIAQPWSDNKNDIINSINNISANGGTNCQAGLRTSKKVINSLPEARKKMNTYVIFMSDGVAGYYYDEYGNTVGSGNGSSKNAINAAYNEAKTLQDIKAFYTIGFGPSADSDFLKSLKVENNITTNKHYNADTKDALIKAFAEITGDVNKIELSNVKITDTLSTYVEPVTKDLANYPYTVSVKDPSGNEVPDEANKAGIQCIFDGKMMQFTFQEGYVLKQDYKYTVSFDVKPSQEAVDYFEKNGQYPSENGFNSNDEAKVDYIYGGKPGSAIYDSPQFKFDTVDPLTVTKVWWHGDSKTTNYKEDSVQVDLVRVDEKNNVSLLNKVETLNDANNWTHTWNNLLKYDYSNDQITEINYEVRELQADQTIVNAGELYVGNKYSYKTTYAQQNKQDAFVVTNDYQPSSLTVTKKVNGNFGDAGNAYKIKISLTDLNGNKVNKKVKAKKTFKETNTPLEIEFKDGVGYVELKHNESVELAHLGNVEYLVEEVDSKGHIVSIENQKGTLKGTSEIVTITNTKNGIIDAGIDNTPLGFMGVVISGLVISILGVLGMKRRYL